MSCTCAGENDPGKFNVRLTIEENSATTQNTRGEIVPSWTPIGTAPHIWASYEQGMGRELIAAQQIKPEINGIVKTLYRSDVTPRNRFKVKGTSRIVEIVSVADPDQSKTWLVCLTKETL